MEKRLQAAFWAPVPDWKLLLFVGMGPALLGVAFSRELLIPTLILAAALQIFVFGRIVSRVLPNRESGFFDILRVNGVNYLIVGVIAAVFSLLCLILLSRIGVSGIHRIVFTGVVKAVVGAFMVFVWPLVFLRNSSVGALFAGVKFLVQNPGKSFWIVVTVALGQVLQTVGSMLFVEYREGWAFVVLLIMGAFSVYFFAVAFSAALYSLLNTRVVEIAVEA